MSDLRTIVAEAIAPTLECASTPAAMALCRSTNQTCNCDAAADAVLARLEPLLRAAHWAVRAGDRSVYFGITPELRDALTTWMATR